MSNIDMRVPFEDLLQACEDLYTELEISKRRIAAELGRRVHGEPPERYVYLSIQELEMLQRALEGR
jgi:hypothetical protein